MLPLRKMMANRRAQMPKEEGTTVRLSRVTLAAAVFPEPLDAVLASLQFKRIIRSYSTDGNDVVIKMLPGADAALVLMQLKEKGSVER